MLKIDFDVSWFGITLIATLEPYKVIDTLKAPNLNDKSFVKNAQEFMLHPVLMCPLYACALKNTFSRQKRHKTVLKFHL